MQKIGRFIATKKELSTDEMQKIHRLADKVDALIHFRNGKHANEKSYCIYKIVQYILENEPYEERHNEILFVMSQNKFADGIIRRKIPEYESYWKDIANKLDIKYIERPME